MPTRAERQAEAARRRAQVVQLRLAGASFTEIGRHLGISDTRVHQLWADALQRTVKEPADQQRMLELQRLDQLQAAPTAVLQAIHHVIQAGKVVVDGQEQPYVDHGPTLAAVQALVRIQESRRKLLGLDAPSTAQLHAKVGVVTVDQRDAEIAELEAQLAADDPDWRPARELGDLADRFRRTWSTPGTVDRARSDPAAFVAGALELGVSLLDPSDQEAVAVEVERFLWERAR